MSLASGVSPFAALERSALFAGIAREDLMNIALQMQPRSFKAGEELCRKGEQGDRLWVIANGLAYVVGPGESGIVGKRRRGDAVGAVGLVTGEPHSATVVAGIPTEALELRRKAFDALVERHPIILRHVTGILSRRLERSTARASRSGERGEAVGLIVGPSLAAAVPELVQSARLASPRPVESLDTRTGFDAAVAQLDDLLEVSGTVLITARAEGRTAPYMLEHVDRALVLVEEARDAERFRAGAGRVEAALARPGGADGAGGLPVVRSFALDAGAIPPADLAWLGRHLSGTKLGLVLGAGGAKGYAHVGALQVLEEAGYVVDYVGGASIGAIIGAYVALGMNAAEIERTLREAFTEDANAKIFSLSLAGQSIGIDVITRIFRETTMERSFDETDIPLVLMAVDLTERASAPLREGPIWEALRASTALAGMFPPYERDGHRLVDGVALIPVPTGAVAEDGADVTVSVNLMSRETLAAWPGREPPPPAPEKRGSRMLETLLEVMDLSQLDTSVRHAALADVVMTPRFGPGSWRDFHLADLFLSAGREAAEAELPALRSLALPQAALAT
jgi:NTE family protein